MLHNLPLRRHGCTGLHQLLQALGQLLPFRHVPLSDLDHQRADHVRLQQLGQRRNPVRRLATNGVNVLVRGSNAWAEAVQVSVSE